MESLLWRLGSLHSPKGDSWLSILFVRICVSYLIGRLSAQLSEAPCLRDPYKYSAYEMLIPIDLQMFVFQGPGKSELSSLVQISRSDQHCLRTRLERVASHDKRSHWLELFSFRLIVLVAMVNQIWYYWRRFPGHSCLVDWIETQHKWTVP